MRVEASSSALAINDAEIVGIVRRIDRPVVLVGLMGAGKSTVGRRLAALMGVEFTDADEAIERAAQMPITEIFDRFGEAYFRDGERRVLARLMAEKSGVIATGGGAFADTSTRELVLGKAIAVWIDAEIDTLVERTGRRNTRPLLRDGDPKEILSKLRDRRGEFYAQAHVRVASDKGPHQTTALAILEAIDRWL